MFTFKKQLKKRHNNPVQIGAVQFPRPVVSVWLKVIYDSKMNKHEMSDIVVVGSGAAGMTAALTGSLLGLKVRILEKSDVVGGTTALSAGSVWIPNSIHSKSGADNKNRAKTYLRNTVGNRLKPELCDAFLENGPAMVKFLEDTPMIFRAYPIHPDY